MPEVLIETVPFVIGAALGYLTFDSARRWPNLAWLAVGSVLLGELQSAFAGELARDLLEAATAVTLDSAAVAVAWAGTHLVLRHGRAVIGRA